MTQMTAIAGNTYIVKDQLRALGGRWDADRKTWMVPEAAAARARALVGSPTAPAPHRTARRGATSGQPTRRAIGSGETEVYRDTGPYTIGDATRMRGSDAWLTVVACGKRRITEGEDDTREGEVRYWAHVRPATADEAASAEQLRIAREATKFAGAAALKALETGAIQPRDAYPSGRVIARQPARGSMASLPYLIADGAVVHHIRPVYDDSPIATLLPMTAEQAIETARVAGWDIA